MLRPKKFIQGILITKKKKKPGAPKFPPPPPPHSFSNGPSLSWSGPMSGSQHGPEICDVISAKITGQHKTYKSRTRYKMRTTD